MIEWMLVSNKILPPKTFPATWSQVLRVDVLMSGNNIMNGGEGFTLVLSIKKMFGTTRVEVGVSLPLVLGTAYFDSMKTFLMSLQIYFSLECFRTK